MTTRAWHDGGTTPDLSPADTADFVSVYRLHYPRVVGALELAGLAPAGAEDVGQEAFARAYRNWRRVRKGTNPPGYVYMTAFRLFRQGGGLPGTALDDHDSPAAGPEDWAVTGITVREAVARMPPRRRACAVLCLYLGLTADEAGDVLGIEASTVRVQLHRARTTLQGVLADAALG